MKKRLRAYLYVPVLALFVATTGAYVWEQNHKTERLVPNQVYYLDDYFKKETEIIPKVHLVDEKQVVVGKSTESEVTESIQTETEAEFLLQVVGDQVIVYRMKDRSESYMQTGISIEELPEETVKEIMAGKEILNEEALYFFLESYSS